MQKSGKAMAPEHTDWLSKAQGLFPELESFLFQPQFYDSPNALWIDLFYLL